jgi:gas vesicle protein
MREVIILEIQEAKTKQLVQSFLKQKGINYRILAETQTKLKEKKQEEEQLKKRLITAYQRQAKNKKLQAELSLWDSISGDGL